MLQKVWGMSEKVGYFFAFPHEKFLTRKFMRKKLIGYVSGRDFPLLIEKDIQALDVINIAFGAVENGRVIYKEPAGFEKELQRVRIVHPQCKLVLSVGGWTAGGFS